MEAFADHYWTLLVFNFYVNCAFALVAAIVDRCIGEGVIKTDWKVEVEITVAVHRVHDDYVSVVVGCPHIQVGVVARRAIIFNLDPWQTYADRAILVANLLRHTKLDVVL